MAPAEERFARLESKVDRIQDQMHSNHLELLQAFNKANDAIDDQINNINLKLKEHDGHFGLMAKLLSAGSILGGWLGLKEFWPKQ